MLRETQASAPGSLMLMGEHAVLHGYPAIIMSLPHCITVQIILPILPKANSDNLIPDSLTPSESPKIYIYSALGNLSLPINTILNRSNFKNLEFKNSEFKNHEYVLKTLHQTLTRFLSQPALRHLALNFNHAEIKITSDFTSSVGLGSSTAVVVALLKALYQIQNSPLSSAELFSEALKIIREIQGRASGADVAASVYGGCLFYQQEKIEIMPYQPIIQWKFSGEKVPTSIAISHVNLLDQNYREPIFEKIGEAVLFAKQAILDRNPQEFLKNLNQNQKLMEALFLDTPNLKQARQALQKNPKILATKISGAGLGDGVIGFSGFSAVNAPAEPHNLDFLSEISAEAPKLTPTKSATAFAPINIALVKYWGKRNISLNLPVTDSLSLSAKHTGTTTTISMLTDHSNAQIPSQIPPTNHLIFLNGSPVSPDTDFYSRLSQFLAFTAPNISFEIHTQSDIPVAAGLASSASGYASIVLALNELLDWQLSKTELSVLARQGSGSACRSLWPGLVHWKKGLQDDGRDSHGEPLEPWPELALGVFLLDSAQKKISSRDGMTHCQQTSPLYSAWPDLVKLDIQEALHAIKTHDFQKLGEITEHSSIAMHQCMRASKPSLDYSLPETFELIQAIQDLRKTGTPIYFTQDAGPNIKILFLEPYFQEIQNYFANKFENKFENKFLLKKL